MSFDITTLITDRTAADLSRWEALRNKGYANMTLEERREWNSSMKGSYNATDLNRVGEALNYLYGRLYEANYITPATQFTAKTNWTRAYIPTAEDLTHYLKCVAIIREAMAQYSTTPPTPTDTGSLNFEEANNIEQILVDVESLINNMLAARYFCGDLCAGEI